MRALISAAQEVRQFSDTKNITRNQFRRVCQCHYKHQDVSEFTIGEAKTSNQNKGNWKWSNLVNDNARWRINALADENWKMSLGRDDDIDIAVWLMACHAITNYSWKYPKPERFLPAKIKSKTCQPSLAVCEYQRRRCRRQYILDVHHLHCHRFAFASRVDNTLTQRQQ